MLGLAIEVVVGSASHENLAASFSKERVDVPMAPATGLYLDELFFDGYNMRCDKNQSKSSSSSSNINDGNDDNDDDDNKDDNNNDNKDDKKTETIVPSEKLEWSSDPNIAPLIDSFRKDVVWPHIAKEADENVAFIEYLDEQRKHPHAYVPHAFKNGATNNDANNDANNNDNDNDE